MNLLKAGMYVTGERGKEREYVTVTFWPIFMEGREKVFIIQGGQWLTLRELKCLLHYPISAWTLKCEAPDFVFVVEEKKSKSK